MSTAHREALAESRLQDSSGVVKRPFGSHVLRTPPKSQADPHWSNWRKCHKLRLKRNYPPASPLAVKAGCTCPYKANRAGEGIEGQWGRYIVRATCPMHGRWERWQIGAPGSPPTHSMCACVTNVNQNGQGLVSAPGFFQVAYACPLHGLWRGQLPGVVQKRAPNADAILAKWAQLP